MAKRVTTIPATLNRFDSKPLQSVRKRKVAGYGRVSTDTEEQATSYAAQVDYYTRYIKSNPEWEFVGMYTDEGIIATNTNHRDGFNQMIEDALAGKIDLIITKSVSRFARNTVDSLTTVRELKEKGIEIYFEKENIWTLDAKGELLITIMSSLAQEESRSISENTTWGKRKAFADRRKNSEIGLQKVGFVSNHRGLTHPTFILQKYDIKWIYDFADLRYNRNGKIEILEVIMAFDFKKEYKEFYMPKKKPEIVNVPKANYIAVRGKGNPNEEGGAYQQAISVLYAVAYTLKMSYKTDYKIEGFFEYVVPPLEGFWWQDNVEGVDYTNKSAFNWISVIRLPDFISKADFDWAVETATKKKKLDCSSAEYLTIDEGLCVQIMHMGSFDDEPATVALMDTYLEQTGYVNDINKDRLHHEIYMSDARKVAPEKWKTVIRHPIKKA